MAICLTSFVSLSSLLCVSTFLFIIPGDFCVDIIGGKEVKPHSRPYMALIQGEKTICGGALIKEDWVITAAHCSTGKKTSIILGAHWIKKKETERQSFTIKKEIPFPHYNKKTHEGDLKLLQLNKKAKITKAVSLLKLPSNVDDVRPGTKCQVAGWGKIDNGINNLSDSLREVNVTVIDRTICNDKKHNSNSVITPNMICAGNLKGGKDSCNGDSGGPLICENIFRGITSFGMSKRCGDPKGPGIYTRLSRKPLFWIKETISKVA